MTWSRSDRAVLVVAFIDLERMVGECDADPIEIKRMKRKINEIKELTIRKVK